MPGFYNFYKALSKYLFKDISSEFFNNEKNLWDINLNDKSNITKKIEYFHGNEKTY